MNRPPSDLPPRRALVAAGVVGTLFVGLNIYATVVAFGPGSALAAALTATALIVVGTVLAGAEGMSRLELLSLASVATLVFATAGTAAVIVDDGSDGRQAPAVAKPVSLAQEGHALVEDLACLRCHTTSGGRSIGPTWRGLLGSDRDLKGKGTIVADHEYIVRSIVDPDAEIASGFPKGLMSGMFAKGSISEVDAETIAAYIESLDGG